MALAIETSSEGKPTKIANAGKEVFVVLLRTWVRPHDVKCNSLEWAANNG